MRKFVMLAAAALVATAAIVSVAVAGGTAPNTTRSLGVVVTKAKANQPVKLDITLKTTKTVTPAGTACTPFGTDCVLPDISVHDDIVSPKFRWNGGVLKGSSTGKVTGSPIFPVCSGADTTPKNGIPDIVESASGPGSKCKAIGGGSATGYTHTCGDTATPATQATLGRQVSATVSTYNGGGSKNGNGGTLFGRLVIKSASAGSEIAHGAIKVTWSSKGKISFEVPDGLIKPFGACAPLTQTVLNLSKKSATAKRKVHGQVRSVTYGLVESSSCPSNKKWAFSNTVRLSTGAADPSTLMVIRDPSNAAVTSATGNTTVKCS